MKRLLLTLLFLLAPGIARATFPVEASTAVSAETSAVSTHDMTAPSGIASGNLLLLIVNFENVGNLDPTASGLTGWTQVSGCAVNHGDATFASSMEVWHKFATGSETSTTYTSSAAVPSFTRWIRITGAHASTPPECSTHIDDYVQPDSASLTASWGAEDNLWYSVYNKYNGCDTLSAYPSGYSIYQYDATPSCTYYVQFSMAGKQANAATENPGAWTISDVGPGVSVTLVVRPSAVASPSTRNRGVMILP